MPTIKNIGKQQRMVVDRYLSPGESRYISPKRVDGFKGDPDFEIVDETPVTLLKVQIVDDEPLQAQPEVDPGLDTPVSTPATRPASKVKRSKKK
jgi:hypothetical protein